MSKSLGNGAGRRWNLIDDTAADAVRFTLTADGPPWGRDLKLSTARIRGYRTLGTQTVERPRSRRDERRVEDNVGTVSTPAKPRSTTR